MKAQTKKIQLFIFALAVPLLVGFFGSFFVSPASLAWYGNLAKPVFTLPAQLFAPVWLVLYILMGLAFFLVLKEGKEKKNFRSAWLSFAAQLFLNLYWLFLFFLVKEPPLAFYALVSLLSMAVVNIYYFYKIRKSAAYLLIPYVLWLVFASALNYAIWYLN